MANALPDLVGRIRLDTSDLDKVQGKASGALGGIAKAAAVAGAAAGAALAGFAVVGVKGAIDVQSGLSEVVTLLGQTGKAAKETLGGFQRDTAALSNELGIAQGALTKGLYQAISAGVPKDNAFEFMRVASKASVAGVTDVETAVNGLTGFINAFGLSSKDAQRVSDSMFTTVKGGKTDFAQLSAAVSAVAPTAAAAGIEFTEVNAALQTLTKQNVPTAEASTKIRAAIVAMSKPSKELTKIFQDAGYESGEAAIKQVGLSEAMGIVNKAAGGSGAKLTQLLGTVEAVGAVQIITGTGAKDMADALQQQADAAGATDDAFEVMGETVARQMETAKVRLHNAAIAFGTLLLPAITAVVGALASFSLILAQRIGPATVALAAKLKALVGFLKDNADTIKTVARNAAILLSPVLIVLAAQLAAMGVAAVISAAKTVAAFVAKTAAAIAYGVQMYVNSVRVIASFVAMGVAAAASAVRTVASWVAAGAAAAAGAAGHAAAAARVVAGWVLMGVQALAAAARVALAWVIALGPIALVIAAVVGLAVVIYKNLDDIKAAITAAWQAVKAATAAVWGAITAAFRATWDAIKGVFTSALDAIKAAVTAYFTAYRALITTVLNAIRTAVSAAWDAIKGVFTTVLSAIGALLQRSLDGWQRIITTVLGAIKAVITTVWDGIKAVFTTVLGVISGLITTWLNNAKANITTVLNAVKGVVQSVLSAIQGVFTTVWNAVLGVVKGVLSALQSTVTGALAALRGAISGGLAAVAGLFGAAFQAAAGAVSAGANAVLGIVSGIPGRILSALGNVGSLLSGAGSALMQGLANGVQAAGQRVIDAARAIVQKVKDLLPGSPIKAGPLKSWNRGGAGKRLMGLLAEGIQAGAPGVQRTLASALESLPSMDALGAAVGAAGAGPRRGVGSGAGGATAGATYNLELHGVDLSRDPGGNVLTALRRMELLTP